MISIETLTELTGQFDVGKLRSACREATAGTFRPSDALLVQYDGDGLTDFRAIGQIEAEGDRISVMSASVAGDLNERSGRKKQYDVAKRILKDTGVDAGLFSFQDTQGRFRLSLVYPEYAGTRRRWSSYRRFTYFVDPSLPNKTFIQRLGSSDFTSVERIKDAFSVTAVTDLFYKEFEPRFQQLTESVQCEGRTLRPGEKRDIALLFVIRTVFLGFLQKRLWLGDDEHFLQRLLREYDAHQVSTDTFYRRWLEPLFFEALTSPPGTRLTSDYDFGSATLHSLQTAPYLNGGLFKRRISAEADETGCWIPDQSIREFFDFLFSYNFVVEENTLYDQELELNPEFLGIIFERLVNKADGAVYTPRTEVNFMCRMGLLKWLQRRMHSGAAPRDLYELFFPEADAEGVGQRRGEFSHAALREMLSLIESVLVCDPAVGSGAFLVGMLQVLDDVEASLRARLGERSSDAFERRRRIISRSLYGVDVKEWAVWIAQLRLWITLFIDAPDDLRTSSTPILPSLDFKIRHGDSLIQRVGSVLFPVSNLNMASMKPETQRKVDELRNHKVAFYNNTGVSRAPAIRQEEHELFDSIIQDSIDSLEVRVRQLRSRSAPTEAQSGLWGEEADSTVSSVDQRIEALQQRVTELKVEQRNLVSADVGGKPLIWNIEFAEVFAGEQGGFDIVIGNPPYVSQTHIADPLNPTADKQVYKKLLSQMVRLDFPTAFRSDVAVSARSDLYTFFYIRSLRLLNRSGVLVFICSNAWLDADYGAWLQKFLLDHAPVEFIIDNQAKRTFERADINTIITVIDAPLPPQQSTPPDHLVRFVSFKCPFDQALVSENLICMDEATTVVNDTAMRVVPRSVTDLLMDGTAEGGDDATFGATDYVGDQWGSKWLRAPDIYFTVLAKAAEKLVKLEKVVDSWYGIKTGANKFFYLTPAQAAQWEIEPEFLRPFLFSLKEIRKYGVDPTALRRRIFWCSITKRELRRAGKIHALAYIEAGERAGLNRRPSMRGRPLWYSLSEHQNADFVSNRFLGERFGFPAIGNIPAGDVFFTGSFHTEPLASLGLINSTVTFLIVEILARKTFGVGVAYLYGPQVRRLPLLDVACLTESQRRSVELAFTRMRNRDILTVFEECGLDPTAAAPIEQQDPRPLADRAALDTVVFDALGLTDEERKDTYRGLCCLVANRIAKSRSI